MEAKKLTSSPSALRKNITLQLYHEFKDDFQHNLMRISITSLTKEETNLKDIFATCESVFAFPSNVNVVKHDFLILVILDF